MYRKKILPQDSCLVAPRRGLQISESEAVVLWSRELANDWMEFTLSGCFDL